MLGSTAYFNIEQRPQSEDDGRSRSRHATNPPRPKRKAIHGHRRESCHRTLLNERRIALDST
jgi:hypothetical protein